MDESFITPKCCGCTSCISICPKGAISLKADPKGFYKALINNDKCIKCHICEKICPEITNNDNGIEYQKVFLFKTKDEKLYYDCSSGAANAVLINYFLERGAKIYGVAFDNNMNAVCFGTKQTKDAVRFRGSKYIQARYDNIPASIEKDLKEGLEVFITATPCVITGIKNYLVQRNVDCSNLVTCDFLCHGVGSPKMWMDYIDFLSKFFGKPIIDFKFRVKVSDVNSHTHHSKVSCENGGCIFDKIQCKIYQNLYFKNLIMNESCYSCSYASSKRNADISLGDNSGYKPHSDDTVEFRHTSLILINSKKGFELIELLKSNGYVKEIDISEVVQPHLKKSNSQPSNYSDFWDTYERKGFKYISKKYGGNNLMSFLKMKKSKII